MADYWVKVDYEPLVETGGWNFAQPTVDFSPVLFMGEPIEKPAVYGNINPFYPYLNSELPWSFSAQGFVTNDPNAGSDPSIVCVFDGTCYQLTGRTYYSVSFSVTEFELASDFTPEKTVGDDQLYVLPAGYNTPPIEYVFADYVWVLVKGDGNDAEPPVAKDDFFSISASLTRLEGESSLQFQVNSLFGILNVVPFDELNGEDLIDASLVSNAEGRVTEQSPDDNYFTYTVDQTTGLSLLGDVDTFTYEIETIGGKDTAEVQIQYPSAEAVAELIGARIDELQEEITDLERDRTAYFNNDKIIARNERLVDEFVFLAGIETAKGLVTLPLKYGALLVELVDQYISGQLPDIDESFVNAAISDLAAFTEALASGSKPAIGRATGELAKNVKELSGIVGNVLTAIDVGDILLEVAELEFDTFQRETNNDFIEFYYGLGESASTQDFQDLRAEKDDELNDLGALLESVWAEDSFIL